MENLSQFRAGLDPESSCTQKLIGGGVRSRFDEPHLSILLIAPLTMLGSGLMQ